MEKKIVLVTGAASGFGAMMARALARAGHQVYASMRDLSAHGGRPDRVRAQFLERIGFTGLLHPTR